MSQDRPHLQGIVRDCTAMMLVLATACTAYQVIPSHLKDRIDKDLSFERIQKNPEAYRGRTVILGGKILDVAQENGHTRIEIL